MLKLTEIAKNCEIVKHVSNKNKNLDNSTKCGSTTPRIELVELFLIISINLPVFILISVMA